VTQKVVFCLELKQHLAAKQSECEQLNTRIESQNCCLKVN